ncbi:uncharacterized protein SCHCODRAFT_02679610 [Schizophyllum commune H4-8]|uniref:Uncharacterized protein n=1 Tax=Schizophyllum commune (strain H4-8 / FGSC 9210) TaxID=578458 RepID=D8Q8R9_SCHCM|nr:uncharacterized protein SCHCODRAFT_02679610 [Schizophyllum commune H4-8]KAI5890702.1 hypothetical protein SCHCODRAFT_02679610 [Schizophyllum commune H4-8]
MPKASKVSLSRSLKASLAAATSSRNTHHAEPLQDTENVPPPSLHRRRATRARPDPPTPSALEELANLRVQHATLVNENLSLHAGAAELELRLLDLDSELKREKETVSQFRREKKALQATLSAEEAHLKKEQKNHKRLKREKRRQEEQQQIEHAQHISDLETQHATLSASITSELDALRAQNLTLRHDLEVACARVERLRQSAETHRREKYAQDKKILRCLESLRRLRNGLLELHDRLTFNPKDGNHFSTQSRWISRRLNACGVPPGQQNQVITDTASLFGIMLSGPFLSRRTAGRVNVGELDRWSVLQLAQEVKNTMGFICSSDGTSHKKIQYEATAISHAVPTYEPGVDDSDPSTWVQATRFVSVKEAVRHDAESQHRGKLEFGKEMADVYNRSPLATADGGKMRDDEWSVKQLGQSKDHAADGIKEKALAEAQKEQDIKKRLAQEAYSKVDMHTLLDAVFSLTEADVQHAIGENRDPSDVRWAERCDIANDVLKTQLGEEAYANLTGQEKELHTLFIFGGCCSHKDLNAFKYGADALAELWQSSTLKTPPPILLPNKSFDSILALGDKAGVDARLRATDMSSSGGPKFMALLGAIFRHKDDKKGYQQAGQVLVQSFKRELHGDDAISHANLADVNNTRFQSVGKAAIEYVTYDYEYRRTIETICAAKTKAGTNHMESTVLKAMDCDATLMDLIAMGLYMVVVSQAYMAAVHEPGKDGAPLNLLQTVDLHRRIASFCDDIATAPQVLFDDNAPLSARTHDGRPVRNQRFISKCREAMLSTGPEIYDAIAAMFRGAAKGWRRFTSEFAPGGPIDQLTPFQRSVLFIPATNDHNEGALGSLRLFLRRNPCSTTVAFNAIARIRHNNTEKFITKVNNPGLESWVMREGRTVSPKQQMASFQERIAADYCERAADHEYKASEKKRKEAERMARLKAVGLVTDVAAVEAMTLVGLREQLEIHKDIIKDSTLNDKQQFKWGMVKTLAPRRLAVLAALERYRAANPEALGASEMLTLLPSPMEDVTEPCGTHSDIEMDSDEEYMGDEFF